MDNTAKKEHRKRKRIPFDKEITLAYMMERKVKAIDLSQGGLYVHTEYTLKTGTMVEIFLPLKNREIKIKAKVMHEQQGVGMGLKFMEIDETQRAQLEELVLHTRRKPPSFRASKPTILFVDDNEKSRKMIKHKLISEGFWIVEAVDGIEAINALHEEPIDIILLDLYMEKMDGFKVLSIVKGSSKWKHIPVIIYTAHGAEEIIDKAINAGADDFLLKSVTAPKKLAEIMRTFINRLEVENS
jgi:CheY-like chemotaxis protein